MRQKDIPYEKALAHSVEFIGHVRTADAQGKGSFISVNHCGTGVMLISRACVETMIAKLPSLMDTRRVQGLPFAHKFTRFTSRHSTRSRPTTRNGRRITRSAGAGRSIAAA